MINALVDPKVIAIIWLNETSRKEKADAIHTACLQFVKISKLYLFTILMVE